MLEEWNTATWSAEADICPVCGETRVDGYCPWETFSQEVLFQAMSLDEEGRAPSWARCVLRHHRRGRCPFGLFAVEIVNLDGKVATEYRVATSAEAAADDIRRWWPVTGYYVSASPLPPEALDDWVDMHCP